MICDSAASQPAEEFFNADAVEARRAESSAVNDTRSTVAQRRF